MAALAQAVAQLTTAVQHQQAQGVTQAAQIADLATHMQNMTATVSAAASAAAAASSVTPPPIAQPPPPTINVSPAKTLFDKLGKPNEFVPGKDFVQWNFQFLSYIGSQDNALRGKAEKSAQCSTAIPKPTDVDDAAHSEQLYYALSQLTKGAALKIVRTRYQGEQRLRGVQSTSSTLRRP